MREVVRKRGAKTNSKWSQLTGPQRPMTEPWHGYTYRKGCAMTWLKNKSAAKETLYSSEEMSTLQKFQHISKWSSQHPCRLHTNVNHRAIMHVPSFVVSRWTRLNHLGFMKWEIGVGKKRRAKSKSTNKPTEKWWAGLCLHQTYPTPLSLEATIKDEMLRYWGT